MAERLAACRVLFVLAVMLVVEFVCVVIQLTRFPQVCGLRACCGHTIGPRHACVSSAECVLLTVPVRCAHAECKRVRGPQRDEQSAGVCELACAACLCMFYVHLSCVM